MSSTSKSSAAKPKAPPKSNVAVEIRSQSLDISTTMISWLRKFTLKACKIAGFAEGSLNVLIVDDKSMAKLHKQYKNVGGTTDVLTFDLRDADDQPLEGDLVICLDEAGRQARDRGHDVGQELMLYIVHGLLHLGGHDDLTPRQAKLMHQRENEILTELGLGAVFGSLTHAEAKP